MATASAQPRPHQTVPASSASPSSSSSSSVSSPSSPPSTSPRHLDIVYQSGRDLRHSSFIVLHKPAGLAVQAQLPLDSVEHRLRTLHGCTRGVWFPHRIDKHTSGLLVVALSKRVCGVLSRQIEAQQWVKEYRVVASIPPALPCQPSDGATAASSSSSFARRRTPQSAALAASLARIRSPYLVGNAWTTDEGLAPSGEFESLLVRRRLPAHTECDVQREWMPWESTLDATGTYAYSNSVACRPPSTTSSWRIHPFVPENMLYHSVPSTYRAPRSSKEHDKHDKRDKRAALARLVDADAPKLARTSFRLVATSASTRTALYHATLHTGRSHQLRVHFSEAGIPIVADPYYNSYHTVDRLLHESHDEVVRHASPVERVQALVRSLQVADAQQQHIVGASVSEAARVVHVTDAVKALLTSVHTSPSPHAVDSLQRVRDLVRANRAVRPTPEDVASAAASAPRPLVSVYREATAAATATATATSSPLALDALDDDYDALDDWEASNDDGEAVDEDGVGMSDRSARSSAREDNVDDVDENEEDGEEEDEDDDLFDDHVLSVQRSGPADATQMTRDAKMSRAMRAYFASQEALRNLPRSAAAAASSSSSSPSSRKSSIAGRRGSIGSSSTATTTTTTTSSSGSGNGGRSSSRHPALQGPSFYVKSFATLARWLSSWSSSSSSRSRSNSPSRASRSPSPPSSSSSSSSRGAPLKRGAEPVVDRDRVAREWADVLDRFRVSPPSTAASTPTSTPSIASTASTDEPRPRARPSAPPRRATRDHRDGVRTTPRRARNDESYDDRDQGDRKHNDDDDDDEGAAVASRRATTTGVDSSEYMTSRSARKLERVMADDGNANVRTGRSSAARRAASTTNADDSSVSPPPSHASEDPLDDPNASYSDAMWESTTSRGKRDAAATTTTTGKATAAGDSRSASAARGVGAIGWWVDSVERQREQLWREHVATRKGLTRKQEEAQESAHAQHVAALRLARQLEHEQVAMGLQAYLIDFPHPERPGERVRIELPMPAAWLRVFDGRS